MQSVKQSKASSAHAEGKEAIQTKSLILLLTVPFWIYSLFGLVQRSKAERAADIFWVGYRRRAIAADRFDLNILMRARELKSCRVQ